MDAKNSLDGKYLTRQLAPNIRQRLVGYADAIDRSLAPASRGDIAREIAALMVAFRPSRMVSIDEAATMTREYVDVLSDLPLWAIQVGLRKIKLGEVAEVSLDFPPAAPRLRKVITNLMTPVRAERYDIRRVLAAPVHPPEDSARAVEVRQIVLNAWQGLVAEMDTKNRQASKAAEQPKPAFKAPTLSELQEIYKTRPLPGAGGHND